MSMYKDMMLMESILNEGVEREIQAAFKKPGIGEFIRREFAEATSPGELAMGISGMAEELDSDMKRGKLDVAKDYGFQSQEDIIWFRTFAMNVVRNAQTYFKEADALHESEEGELKQELDAAEEQATHSTGDTKDHAEEKVVDLVTTLNRLGYDDV